MTKRRTGSTSSRLTKVFIPSVALAAAISWGGLALAQGSGPGTAGGANAAAASNSLGGGGPPTTPGTAPGSTSPGGINSAPEVRTQTPSTSPDQVPSTAGATTDSTTPQRGTVGMTTGRIPGHTGRVSTVEEKSDPVVEETEKEVSRRIKNICRGC